MFNTTTGLFESSNNTGTGISSLEVDSLVIPTGIDLALIEDLGSKNIITDNERSQITTNQNAITTNSNAILAINNKIAPISYQPSPNELYVNSNVLLQDPANSATKYDLTCDDISCDDIQCDDLTADAILCNSIVSNGVNLNTAITSLETKTTNQTFASNKTSFTGDFEVERLTINGTDINKGSGSIITTAERDSLDTISDFTKNVLSDTLFIDNHLYIGSVGTQKDITCNDIDCNVLTPYNTATAILSVGGIPFSNTMPSQITANTQDISANTQAISSLETKTTNQSFSSNTTTFTGDTYFSKILIDGHEIDGAPAGVLIRNNLALQDSGGTNKDLTCNDITCNDITLANIPISNISNVLTVGNNVAFYTASTNTYHNLVCGVVQASELDLDNTSNNLTGALVDDIIINSKLQITNPNTDKAIEIFSGGSVDRSDLTGGTFVDLSNVQSPQYKRTIYKINVNNTTGATATYFIDTGLGDKDVFNLTFTYKRSGVNFWENSRNWLQYIRYHSGGSLQGKIELLNISAGQQMVGYITLEYINL